MIKLDYIQQELTSGQATGLTPQSIKTGWKCLLGTNTLANFRCKTFYKIGPVS